MLMDPARNKKTAAVAAKTVGAGLGFERTRRITGYLVGALDRFNNAKRAEERDRVKHCA
ncbi:MAG: hypothetical protein LBV01_05655 [Deltaproteobacteria bacterium]|nr:hypothetical protein [Deltaproteobacteria bacterium]